MSDNTKSPYTPGPWRAERAKRPDNTGGFDYAIADQDNQIVAECFEHTGYAGGTDRQYIIQPVQANAQLVAAAPDLLEALKSIRLYANDTLSGRVDGPADARWYAEGIAELRNRARAAIALATGEKP